MARTIPTRLAACFLLFLLMALASPAAVPAGNGCSEGQQDAAGSAAITSSGLKAYIDPQTGELTDSPPAGQAGEPEAPAATRPELVEETKQDGTVLLRLDDRFHSDLKADNSDGTLVFCHDQPGQDGQAHDH